MSVKENKELVRRWCEPTTPPEMADIGKAKDPRALIEKLIRAGVNEFFSPDFIIHLPNRDGDRETVIQENLKHILAFPDMTYKADKIIAEGDMVAVIARTIVPSKKIEIKGVYVFRIANGKFVETWVDMDYSDTMRLIENAVIL
jgi:predicted SnoaL-like aldol condensation-catalyzing enzyme